MTKPVLMTAQALEPKYATEGHGSTPITIREPARVKPECSDACLYVPALTRAYVVRIPNRMRFLTIPNANRAQLMHRLQLLVRHAEICAHDLTQSLSDQSIEFVNQFPICVTSEVGFSCLAILWLTAVLVVAL